MRTYTSKEVAEVLNVTRPALWNWRRKDYFPCMIREGGTGRDNPALWDANMVDAYGEMRQRHNAEYEAWLAKARDREAAAKKAPDSEA